MSISGRLSEAALSRRHMILSGASLAVLPWLGKSIEGMVLRRPVFQTDPSQLGVAYSTPAIPFDVSLLSRRPGVLCPANFPFVSPSPEPVLRLEGRLSFSRLLSMLSYSPFFPKSKTSVG